MPKLSVALTYTTVHILDAVIKMLYNFDAW